MDLEERTKRMGALVANGYLFFEQVDGQRIYGPPKIYANLQRPKGSEIFVSNIPKDVYEDDLIKLFSGIGELYQVRFMMEYSGRMRGFAYVVYLNNQTALKAIKKYHGYLIQKDHRLACYMSLNNSRLYVEGLPTDISPKKAKEIISKLFENVADVITFPHPGTAEMNLGICFIEFASHRTAANFRKLFWPSRVSCGDKDLFVEWACALPSFTESFVVIVCHLTNNIDNKEFIKFVLNQMQEECICNITKYKTFGTIQFVSRRDAIKCELNLTGKILDGEQVEPIFIDPEKYDERYISNIMLFLQWGQFNPQSLVIAASLGFTEIVMVYLSVVMSEFLCKSNKMRIEDLASNLDEKIKEI